MQAKKMKAIAAAGFLIIVAFVTVISTFRTGFSMSFVKMLRESKTRAQGTFAANAQGAAFQPKTSQQEYQNSATVTRKWNPDYVALEKKLQDYVADLERETGQKWGIYFEDLTSGKSFGVNPDLWVPAASTVKVPVVLYASYLVSRGELSWDERLMYIAERDWRPGAGSLQFTAKDHDTFTIRELCEKAIVESDNVAWKMLERRLGKENIANFMTQLGGNVVYPNGQNVSTPRDMATYMKAALLFARDNPEGKKLLYDLAHTIWNTGLNRFIPSKVKVAHKEGDVIGVANDVGIVYDYRPYIIAIMSRGHEDVEAGFEEIGRRQEVKSSTSKRSSTA